MRIDGSTDSLLSLCAAGYEGWIKFALDGSFFESFCKDLAC